MLNAMLATLPPSFFLPGVQIHVDLVRSSKQMTGYMCLRHEAMQFSVSHKKYTGFHDMGMDQYLLIPFLGE